MAGRRCLALSLWLRPWVSRRLPGRWWWRLGLCLRVHWHLSRRLLLLGGRLSLGLRLGLHRRLDCWLRLRLSLHLRLRRGLGY